MTTPKPWKISERIAALGEQPDDFDEILARDAKPKMPVPGDEIHVLAPITILVNDRGFSSSSASLGRGQTVVVTSEMIEASRDRNGDSWLSIVGDPEAQRARWGEVRLGLGRFPEDLKPWTYGSVEWEIARDAARSDAYARPTESERRAALEALERDYGPGAITSRSSTKYPRMNAAQEAQEERFRQHRAGGYR